MKPNLENLNEYTKHASLSQEEKFDMLQNLRTYSANNPVRPTFYSLFIKHGFAYASIFALLIGTGATSIAAESSLPGDLLYPIKTEVNESVVRSLSFSPSQKAKNSASFVHKRMNELERLVIEQKDTQEHVDIIIAKLEEHTTDFADAITTSEITPQEEVLLAQISSQLGTLVDTQIEEILTLEDTISSTEATSSTSTLETIPTYEDDTPQTEYAQSNTSVEKKATESITSIENTTQEKTISISQSESEIQIKTKRAKPETIEKITQFSDKIDTLIIEIQSSKNLEDESETI